MADEPQEVVLSEETVKLLRKRKVKRSGKGCFLCKLILLDFEKNKKLTGYPLDATGQGTFPVEGKMNHVALEKESQTGDVKE